MPAKKVLITLTENLQKELDEQVKLGRFVSRSEVIREAVRNFLDEKK
jgi:Arc/MetJ-type ribon-helix-helix transcriptional regulator